MDHNANLTEVYNDRLQVTTEIEEILKKFREKYKIESWQLKLEMDQSGRVWFRVLI